VALAVVKARPRYARQPPKARRYAANRAVDKRPCHADVAYCTYLSMLVAMPQRGGAVSSRQANGIVEVRQVICASRGEKRRRVWYNGVEITQAGNEQGSSPT